jgi:hypothetical protein
MSEQSEQIGELAKALAIAQGKITGALKDSSNPFFKSRYADLASVWDACRGPLSENGLAVVQLTESDDAGVYVSTTLAHSSGQWVRSRLRLQPKDSTPQGLGSAITYGRRYALAAIVGVAQVDDDGNAASGRQNGTHDPHEEMHGKWTAQDTKKANEFAKRVIEAVDDGRDVMEVWDEITPAGEEFVRAVWVGLPKPIKTLIKDENDKRNKAKAA